MTRKLRNTWTAYLLLFPALLLFLVFVLIPFAYEFWISLHHWDGFGEMKYIGIDNYVALLKDEQFYLALKHNLLYALGTVFGKVVLALLIALLLNGAFRGVVFFRTVFFMPAVMSFVAIGILWQWIYNPSFGMLDAILVQLGIIKTPIQWLGQTSTALLSLIFVDIWRWTGYHMVLFLAGIQSIQKNLYEAAEVDGASAMQKLFHITLPQLKTIALLNIVISAMGAFNVFDIIYVMTDGGPYNSTNVLLTYMYKQTFGASNNVGYGTTIAFALFLIILAITFVQLRVSERDQRA
ncbi:carbohydrate ABC transporter permease [Cohnella abietis]|uniref:ABC transporter permease n=1 Tax=Cohnella abietis TaxID=2507935 RepID=A0A3T1DEY2_9BACL|nr:sugar ABC transporter permease [Cohnella abietis]BBI36659.1 ABC transporter permease [Cohnella abietis]